MPPDEVTSEARRLRAAIVDRPLRSYRALGALDADRGAPGGAADELLAGVWRAGSFGAIPIGPGIEWASAARGHRSWDFLLQCLDPVDPLLARFDRAAEGAPITGDPAGRLALELAEGWLGAVDERSPMAWYDMAVGLRAPRLAFLLDAAARDPACSDGRVVALAEAVLRHAEWLAATGTFAGHSNHGLYSALGLAVIAARLPDLPGVGGLLPFARALLEGMVAVQFAPDGSHLEHSPGYHADLSFALVSAVEAGLLPAERYRELGRLSREALSWFVMPDGCLVPVGDTEARAPSVRGHPDDASLRWTLGVDEGPAPASRIRAWDSGYVTMRALPSHGGSGRASHLVQLTTHHSAVHRHDDLLGVVWSDRGAALLTDAGRWAYDYDHPRRRYVASTRAHSVLDLPGEPLPQAALTGWGEQGELLWSDARQRRGGLEHRRILVLRPGRWLLLVDRVDAPGPVEPPVRRLQAAPALTVGIADDGHVLLRTAGGEELHVGLIGPTASCGVVIGREEPSELLGWSSLRTLDWRPSPTLADRPTGAPPWVTGVLLRFDAPATEASAAPGPDGSGVDVSWTAPGERVRVQADAGGAPRVVRDG